MEPYQSRPDAPTQTHIGASLRATCTKILYKDRIKLYNNLYNVQYYDIINVQYSSMSKHKQMDFYLLVILDILTFILDSLKTPFPSKLKNLGKETTFGPIRLLGATSDVIWFPTIHYIK